MSISRRDFVPWQGRKSDLSELRSESVGLRAPRLSHDTAMVQRIKRSGITYFWSVTKGCQENLNQTSFQKTWVA